VLKVGDVVCYNSGGHLMTVISIDENSVTCVWSVKGDAKSKSYPAEALKKAAPPPPGGLRELILASMKLEAGDNNEVESPVGKAAARGA
jgi:uncharacterized protein YodC (DUF2158 family)